MPYFKKETDGQVVYRKHEFNSESINGEIRKIDNSADCLLLAHVATKKFNWHVTPMENINPEEGLVKLKGLGVKETSKKGQPFYCLIHSAHLQDYLNFHKEYEFKEPVPIDPEGPTKEKVVKKEPVKEVTRRSEEGEVKSDNESSDKGKKRNSVYKPKLVRDVMGEKPIKILN